MSKRLSKACTALRVELAKLPPDLQERIFGALTQARALASSIGDCPDSLRDAAKQLGIAAAGDFIGEGGAKLKAQLEREFPEVTGLLTLL